MDGRLQVHLLELDEDSRTLAKTVFSHPAGEVWDLQCSPNDPAIFISRYSSLEAGGAHCSRKATMWAVKGEREKRGGNGKHEEQGAGASWSHLEPMCHLEVGGDGDQGPCPDVNHVSFMPGQSHKVITLSGNKLALHDVEQAKSGKSTIISNGNFNGID